MFGRNYQSTLNFTVYPGQGGISNVIYFPDDVIHDQGSAPYNYGTTNWNLYTVTFNCPGNQMVAYYNGQPFQTNTLTLQGLPWLRIYGCSSQQWLCVGAMPHDGTPQWGDDAYPNDGFMVGRMDDIRIYNRALAASEVALLYQANGVSLSPAQQGQPVVAPLGLTIYPGAGVLTIGPGQVGTFNLSP